MRTLRREARQYLTSFTTSYTDQPQSKNTMRRNQGWTFAAARTLGADALDQRCAILVQGRKSPGGFLFALQKLDGGLRPILCGDMWRRCLASLAAQACRKPLARQYLTSFDNFIQCAGIKDGPSHAAHTLGADALDQRCAILVHGRTARHNHSYSQSTRCYVTTRSRAKCQACGVCNCNLQTHDEHAHSLL